MPINALICVLNFPTMPIVLKFCQVVPHYVLNILLEICLFKCFILTPM